MQRLTGLLLQWWQGRTVRERRLLAAMLVTIVGIGARLIDRRMGVRSA